MLILISSSSSHEIYHINIFIKGMITQFIYKILISFIVIFENKNNMSIKS